MNPDDLDQMTRDQLTAEIKRLRHAIREHRESQAAHPELNCPAPSLWAMVPETMGCSSETPDAPSLMGRVTSLFRKDRLPSLRRE